MGQVTIYLDPDSEQRMKQAARMAGLPVSRWLAQLVRERTRGDWSPEVRAAAGAWADFPDAETLRGTAGEDLPREPL